MLAYRQAACLAKDKLNAAAAFGREDPETPVEQPADNARPGMRSGAGRHGRRSRRDRGRELPAQGTCTRMMRITPKLQRATSQLGYRLVALRPMPLSSRPRSTLVLSQQQDVRAASPGDRSHRRTDEVTSCFARQRAMPHLPLSIDPIRRFGQQRPAKALREG